MPALPVVNKVIRFDLFSTLGADSRVRDRFFMAFAGAGPTVADLTTLANTVATAWGTNLSPQQGANTTLTAVQLTDLTSATGAQTIVTTSKPGTGSGNAGGANMCAIIKFKIARRYRGGHARFYFPGPPALQLSTAQQWATAYLSALATAWTNFITAVGTTPPTNIGALTQVNVSYFSGFHNVTLPSLRVRSVPTVRGSALQDTVIAIATNPNVGSQRRRTLQSA